MKLYSGRTKIDNYPVVIAQYTNTIYMYLFMPGYEHPVPLEFDNHPDIMDSLKKTYLLGEFNNGPIIGEEEARDIIINAIESGYVDSWADFGFYDPDRGSVIVIERENPAQTEVEVTVPMVQQAVADLIRTKGVNSQIISDLQTENWDAEGADCVIQQAVLGEVVYG